MSGIEGELAKNTGVSHEAKDGTILELEPVAGETVPKEPVDLELKPLSEEEISELGETYDVETRQEKNLEVVTDPTIAELINEHRRKVEGGQTYSVPRSDGSIDSGWTKIGENNVVVDGMVRMIKVKPEGGYMQKFVSINDMQSYSDPDGRIAAQRLREYRDGVVEQRNRTSNEIVDSEKKLEDPEQLIESKEGIDEQQDLVKRFIEAYNKFYLLNKNAIEIDDERYNFKKENQHMPDWDKRDAEYESEGIKVSAEAREQMQLYSELMERMNQETKNNFLTKEAQKRFTEELHSMKVEHQLLKHEYENSLKNDPNFEISWRATKLLEKIAEITSQEKDLESLIALT